MSILKQLITWILDTFSPTHNDRFSRKVKYVTWDVQENKLKVIGERYI